MVDERFYLIPGIILQFLDCLWTNYLKFLSSIPESVAGAPYGLD